MTIAALTNQRVALGDAAVAFVPYRGNLQEFVEPGRQVAWAIERNLGKVIRKQSSEPIGRNSFGLSLCMVSIALSTLPTLSHWHIMPSCHYVYQHSRNENVIWNTTKAEKSLG
jgi:hypothetical protein